jgi:sulfofructose kinase
VTTVACFGLAVRDLVFSLEAPPAPGSKSFATGLVEQSGGPAATAAVAAARMGADALFVGRVGADDRGRAVLSDLARFGVDVGRCETLAGVSTSTSAVVVTGDGERTVVNHTDARITDGVVDPGDLSCDVVLVDSRWDVMRRSVTSWAGDRHIPVVLDLDLSPMPALSAPHATYTIASRDAARAATGCPEPERAARSLCALVGGTVGVTAGSLGVWWTSGGEVQRVPPPEMAPVETIGAGDVFHGVFAWAIGSEIESSHAFELATRAAAIRCARSGGWSAIPTRAEVES